MTDASWSWTATKAVRLLSRGDVSPRELLASLRSRVEDVGPAVNALPTLCFDRAEEFAKRLEDLPPYARGCFAGLPWAIKDSTPVAGVRTTFGSRAFADFVPRTSDYVVEAIESQGGVVFAKSNTPEFEAGANTFNDVFGATLNPWDLRRSAGGSSGGAAAAVATGMAFLAQGSDFACSVRYPAASYSKAANAGRPPPRAAFSLTLGLAAVAPTVADVVDAALTRLKTAGLVVSEGHPQLADSDMAFRSLRAFQFAVLRRDALASHRDKLKPEVIWNIEEGLKLTAVDLADAECRRGAVRREMLAFLDQHHILITPTAPVEPFPVEQRFVEQINDEKLGTYLDWLVLGYAISVCGCPAISIPCGLSPSGLPVGLQIIGKPYKEAELLRTAAWCESVLGQSLQRPITPQLS